MILLGATTFALVFRGLEGDRFLIELIQESNLSAITFLLLVMLVVFIAGAWAPEGMRFSHASSIVERGRGTAQGKIKALSDAGAHVVDSPEEIAPKIKELI